MAKELRKLFYGRQLNVFILNDPDLSAQLYKLDAQQSVLDKEYAGLKTRMINEYYKPMVTARLCSLSY